MKHCDKKDKNKSKDFHILFALKLFDKCNRNLSDFLLIKIKKPESLKIFQFGF